MHETPPLQQLLINAVVYHEKVSTHIRQANNFPSAGLLERSLLKNHLIHFKVYCSDLTNASVCNSVGKLDNTQESICFDY